MSKLTKKLETLLGSQKSTPLSVSEKAKMRMQLAGFIERNPVQSSWISLVAHRVFRLRPILASLTVVVLFSGVSLASAQTALPGDALYDLKLFVNEEVPMIFMNETEKQDFVVKQMDNRLEEAELLKEKGELTVEQQEVLQSKFDQYFDKISENEHPGKIRKDITTVFEQHQEILPQFTVEAEPVETTDVDQVDYEPGSGPFKPRNSMTLKEFFEATHKPMEELEPEETEDENSEDDAVEVEVEATEEQTVEETSEEETVEEENMEDFGSEEPFLEPIKVPLDEDSEIKL